MHKDFMQVLDTEKHTEVFLCIITGYAGALAASTIHFPT